MTAFFGLLALLGLLLHRDYGVSWDEPTDHLNGLVNVKYLAGLVAPARVRRQASARLIPALQAYSDNDHGVLFEIPVALLSYVFTHHQSRPYYFMRHLLIFATFMAGVWAVYRIGSEWLGDWRRGLGAAGLLVLSPRLFAEAFFNGKDLVFLAIFALAMYTLVRLTRRLTWAGIGWHALATAAAIDVRIPGIVLVPFTLAMLFLTAAARPAAYRRPALAAALYLLLTAAATVAGWPYLWADPVGNFVAAFERLGHFPWPFTNLYFGRFISAQALPWHYAPVWIFITTPLPYTLLAVVGFGAVAARLLRGGWQKVCSPEARLNLLLLGWLTVPLASVILLRSALYDTWRHLYFVYPALVLLAVRGLTTVMGWATHQRGFGRRLALLALGLTGLETAHTAVRMVRLHPYEHLYFSFLPAATVERSFERDYWALSFRPGLEWLLTHDDAPQLRVGVKWPFYNAFYNNSLLLPTEQRGRLQYVPPPSRSRYFITTYRWHPLSYRDSVGREVYCLRAEGVKILSVFDREAK